MSSRLQDELLRLASKAMVVEDERDRIAEHLARALQTIVDMNAKSDLLCLTIERIVTAIAEADLIELLEQIDVVTPLVNAAIPAKVDVAWLAGCKKAQAECNGK